MNKSNQANVHMVEPFGMFDGPGIRYVLFLQGCPFRCKFCHNRNTWSTKTHTIMSVQDVLEDFNKYKAFYKKGGITVSGGEPLLQIDFLIELFKNAKALGIHTTLDTSAACFNKDKLSQIDTLLSYTDLVLLDIKHMNELAHKDLVGASNKNVLAFANHLNKLNQPTIIRHVLIPSINNDEESLKALYDFTHDMKNIIDIEILPYHSQGKHKWYDLGLEYPLEDILEPNQEEIQEATRILKPFKAHESVSLIPQNKIKI
ncbi:MAG: pyruvate formate-lyase-activating protein [Candidatus Izemoplasmataceae bacterium]